MRKLIRSLVFIAIAVICIVMAYNFSLSSNSKNQHSVEHEEVLLSFKDISEIAVEEYNFTNVGIFTSEDAKFLGLSIPFTQKSFIIAYDGTIKAGIKDIDKITYKFNDINKTVNISCPTVEILDGPYIDSSTIRVYDEKASIFNPISINDYKDFVSSEEDSCITMAKDHGLLLKAQERVREVISLHTKAMILNTDKAAYDVEITFK